LPTTKYKDSLFFKFKSAEYHKNCCQDALTRLHLQSHSEKDSIAAESEFIAMMLTLHSCLDVFAQYLNRYFLNDYLPESKVTFYKVIEKVKDEEIKPFLLSLKDDTQYLIDFSNVIKHRNIVRISYYSAFLSPNFPTEFMDIDSFIKDEREYDFENVEFQLKFQYETVINQIKCILLILEKRLE